MCLSVYLFIVTSKKISETRLGISALYWSKSDLFIHVLITLPVTVAPHFHCLHLPHESRFCFSTKIKPLVPKSAPGLSVHACTQNGLGLMAHRCQMQAVLFDLSGDLLACSSFRNASSGNIQGKSIGSLCKREGIHLPGQF